MKYTKDELIQARTALKIGWNIIGNALDVSGEDVEENYREIKDQIRGEAREE